MVVKDIVANIGYPDDQGNFSNKKAQEILALLIYFTDVYLYVGTGLFVEDFGPFKPDTSLFRGVEVIGPRSGTAIQTSNAKYVRALVISTIRSLNQICALPFIIMLES